jgi:hypothetical protein
MEPGDKQTFTGNIFIYHAFDVGDDIDLDEVKQHESTMLRSFNLSKYFKGYHTPISIDLPHPHESGKFNNCMLHNFGVISLSYKIPFEETLEDIRKELPELEEEFLEQSVIDAASMFKTIKSSIKQPKFFHLRTSYVVIQVDQKPDEFTVKELKDKYSNVIASLLRFETEHLSDQQKNEILSDDIGYYRGDLVLIDSNAAFIYDNEYEEILDLFEFANLQLVELQYFDRVLDQQLNVVYQREVRSLPLKTYLPFVGTLPKDPITQLGILRVEISVIIERLKRSIKVAGEDYASEIYETLIKKLDVDQWKEAIEDKLAIVKELNDIYQHKVDSRREDLLSTLIIILIMLELLLAIFKG